MPADGDGDVEGGVRALALALGRLVLRHEDAIAALRFDRSFVLFSKIKGPQLLLKQLWDASQVYKQKRDAGEMQNPLRIILLCFILTELLSRVKLLAAKRESQEEAAKLGFIRLAEGAIFWDYLKWDAVQEQEVKDADKEGLPQHQMIQALEHLIQHVHEDKVTKFGSSRPISEEMTGHSVAFLLEVSGREDEFSRQLRSATTRCGGW